MTSRFDNVLITPFSELLDTPQELSDHRGGPRWPNFEHQTTARHCRAGRPIDAVPHSAQGQPMTLNERVAWGGPIVRHFGHQIADFSMRLLPTVTKHSDVPIAFSSHPRMRITTVEKMPVFVRGVWEWFGITLGKVRLITEPTIAREVVVEPQAEQLEGPGPSDEHLELLDALTKQRLGTVEPIPAVYVSRSGQRARFAGEAYLEEVMKASGVAVVRPETLPLHEQLRIYASADRLIFAEGSALHATQLLGRCLGDVVVLVRRTGQVLGRTSLEPRARSLSYVEASAGVVNGTPPLGPDLARMRKLASVTGISVLDSEPLVEGLASAIPDLASRFDADAFRLARDNDIKRWLATELNPRWATVPDRVLESLRDADVGHLAPEAETILRHLYSAWTLSAVFELTAAVRELTKETHAGRASQERLVELLSKSPAQKVEPPRAGTGRNVLRWLRARPRP